MSEVTPTAEDLEMVIRDYWDPWGSRPTDLAEAILASKWLAKRDAEVAAKALDAMWSELGASSTVYTLDAAMVRIKERANQWRAVASA